MAKVHDLNARGPQKRRQALDEPTQHVESEGDRLIKQLVEKQLNTHLSLEQQLKYERHFERRTEVGALSYGGAQGQTTWQQFEDWERGAELLSQGLTPDEVALLRDGKRRRLEDQVAREMMADIRRKLEPSLDPEQASGVGRHELELAAAVKPGSRETRLFQFAVACRPAGGDPRPPQHPIHSLKALEHQLFHHLLPDKGSPRARRARTPATDGESRCSAPVKASPCSCGGEDSLSTSGWDVNCVKHARRGKRDGAKLYSCKPEVLYTIKDGRIVALERTPARVEDPGREEGCGGSAFVVTDASGFPALGPGSEEGRLSVEEIRRLPRFADYSRGNPSKVLYLKNLQKSMKEEDLVALFGCFEDKAGPKLTYRLMTGRMRGQAFVTFPSEVVATTALECVNGVLWRGQPLVIQFGRPPPT